MEGRERSFLRSSPLISYSDVLFTRRGREKNLTVVSITKRHTESPREPTKKGVRIRSLSTN